MVPSYAHGTASKPLLGETIGTNPRDTRVLGLALSAAANAPLGPIEYGVFRM